MTELVRFFFLPLPPSRIQSSDFSAYEMIYVRRFVKGKDEHQGKEDVPSSTKACLLHFGLRKRNKIRLVSAHALSKSDIYDQ